MVAPGVAGSPDGGRTTVLTVCETFGKKLGRAVKYLQRPRLFSLEEKPLVWGV